MVAYWVGGSTEDRERAERALQGAVMKHIRDLREQMGLLDERVASLEADQHHKGAGAFRSHSASAPTGGSDE